MLPLRNSSLMSPKITKFYLNNPAEQNEHLARFFNANGTFNASAIVDYIWPGQECADILKGKFFLHTFYIFSMYSSSNGFPVKEKS